MNKKTEGTAKIFSKGKKYSFVSSAILAFILVEVLSHTILSDKAQAAQHFNVGWVPNQVHYENGSLWVINSGVNSGRTPRPPSLSRIQLNNQAVSETTLPMATNPFRGVMADGSFWLTYNMTDEVVSVPLSNLLASPSAVPTVHFQPDLSSTGAESIMSVGSNIWVAFSNLTSYMTFGGGEIFILNKSTGQPHTKLKFSEKNPKFMHSLSDGRVAVAFGDYESDSGSIALLEPVAMAGLSGTVELSMRTSPSFAKYFAIGGTPAGIASYKDQELWSCDQNLQDRGRAFKVDLVAGTIQVHPLPFPTCAAVAVNDKFVYFLNLNAGLEGSPKEHLFIYDRGTFSQRCALEVIPERFRSPMLGFPTDLLLFSDGGDKYLSIVMSAINTVSLLKLDENSLPLECL